MKIKGQEIKALNRRLIVIPRDDGREDITLWAQAIPSFERFEQLCEAPKPPYAMRKGGVRDYDYKDPDYRNKVAEHNQKLSAFIVLESLNLPENEIEWETVDLQDHKTWLNFSDEFRNAGFSEIEIGKIVKECGIVNCLNEDHVEAARQLFLNRAVEAE